MIPLGIERLGPTVHYRFDEALKDVHVVMMLRLQLERQGRGLFPTIRRASNGLGPRWSGGRGRSREPSLLSFLRRISFLLVPGLIPLSTMGVTLVERFIPLPTYTPSSSPGFLAT